jgi:hypothetical protein
MNETESLASGKSIARANPARNPASHLSRNLNDFYGSDLSIEDERVLLVEV